VNLRSFVDTVFLRLPLKWWFSGFTAALGAFAGLLGSIYAEQIKSAFPFTFGDGPVVWSAVLFWAALLLFGCLFGLGFNAQNQVTTRLENVIRTLPPRDFLEVFETLFSQSFRVDWKAQEDKQDAEGHKGSIVAATSGLVWLVARFDARGDRARYSANIMVFRPIDTIPSQELKDNMIFAEPVQDASRLDGVLQLQTEFAFTMNKGTLEKDADAAPIMLPIPKPEFRIDEGKPTVLPGAPAVFCDPTTHVGFDDTLKLSDWCVKFSGLRPSIATQIQTYFRTGKGKEIRSFISIPIGSPGQNDQVLGVLNIHCNREGMLPGDKAGLFVPLAHPFVLLIARALHRYGAFTQATKKV
jgi:hypothetical protein